MKCIVKIQPSGKSLRRLLRHVFLPEGRLGREVPALQTSGNRVVTTINGMVGGLVFRPAVDAETLAGDIKGRLPYRHLILSAEDCGEVDQRRNMFRGLMDMAKEFARTYAANVPFIMVGHDDRAHPHAHLIFKNEATDGRCLQWSKDQVRDMQSMSWVSPQTKETFGVESGRGRGVNLPEYSNAPYPLAAKLDAKTIAGANKEQINEYVSSGTLAVGRVDKQGNITSVVFNGRRIRLSTIRGLAGGKQGSSGYGSGGGGGSQPRTPSHQSRHRPRRRSVPSRPRK
jgi:hypothetical protein